MVRNSVWQVNCQVWLDVWVYPKFKFCLVGWVWWYAATALIVNSWTFYVFFLFRYRSVFLKSILTLRWIDLLIAVDIFDRGKWNMAYRNIMAAWLDYSMSTYLHFCDIQNCSELNTVFKFVMLVKKLVPCSSTPSNVKMIIHPSSLYDLSYLTKNHVHSMRTK